MRGNNKTRWILESKVRFRARHALPLPNGGREPVHEHTWVVSARVEAPNPGNKPFSVDFTELRRALETAVEPFVGEGIALRPETRETQSAEHLALAVAERLKTPVAKMGASLVEVAVWEGEEHAVKLLLEAGERQ